MYKRSLRTFIAPLILVGLVSMLGGCASGGEPWHMPKKSNAQSATIVGYLNTAEKDQHLLLRNVNVLKKGRVYGGLGRKAIGEEVVVLDSGHFIAPNVEPGVYFVAGFDAGSVYHIIPPGQIREFTIEAGQVKYLGGSLVVEKDGGLFGPGSFSLKPTNEPSELLILDYLNSVSAGTGWESAIRKRIKALGGDPDKAENTKK
ncbi:MAG TPA: hypothetical protein VKO66_08430 [Sideroxyarcus sp.]|nr:hypothetical protein [Sideroxyarcus sp.]